METEKKSKVTVHRCAACSAPNAAKRCGQCNITYYCSPECQRNAWPLHKVSCASIATNDKVTSKTRFLVTPTHGGARSLDKMIEDEYDDPNLADRMRAKIEAAEAKGKPIDLCGISHEMGFMLIHHAALKGLTPVVKLLLEKGVPVDIRNTMAESSLQLACMYGHTECARLLIEHGANPNVADRHGHTIEYRVKNGIFGKAKAPEILKLLAEAQGKFKSVGADRKAEKKRLAGNEAFTRGELDLALELYAESLRHEEDYRTYSNRAAVHLARRDYGKAADDAYRVTTMKPDFARGWIRQAQCNIGFRDFPRVRIEAEKAVKALSDDPGMQGKFQALVDLLISRGVGDRFSNAMAVDPRRDLVMQARMSGVSAGTTPCAYCRAPIPSKMIEDWHSCPMCICDPNGPGVGDEFDDPASFVKQHFG